MTEETKRKVAQRIANAICELDSASFACPVADADYFNIQLNRTKLFDVMVSLGYEFAKCDSRRIRKTLKIETAASILADMNRKQQAANRFVNISPAQLRKKTLKTMSKRL